MLLLITYISLRFMISSVLDQLHSKCFNFTDIELSWMPKWRASLLTLSSYFVLKTATPTLEKFRYHSPCLIAFAFDILYLIFFSWCGRVTISVIWKFLLQLEHGENQQTSIKLVQFLVCCYGCVVSELSWTLNRLNFIYSRLNEGYVYHGRSVSNN